MLTPQEVAEHGFSKAHVGGYNMKEVDDFLDQMTEDYSALYKESAVLKGKIKVLAEKVSEYRETEEAMRTTLLAAQKMANSMIVQAEEKKAQMLAEAERHGLQRKEQLEREVAETEGKLAAAQVSTQQFIDKVRDLVQQESEFLDQLPTLKGEAVKAAVLKVVNITPEPKPELPVEAEASEETPAAESIPEEAVPESNEKAPEEESEAGDLIDKILQEEQDPQRDVPVPPLKDAVIPEGEFAEELAVPVAVADDAPTRRIDFSNLKFGKDYEIK